MILPYTRCTCDVILLINISFQFPTFIHYGELWGMGIGLTAVTLRQCIEEALERGCVQPQLM